MFVWIMNRPPHLHTGVKAYKTYTYFSGSQEYGGTNYDIIILASF